MKKIIIVIVSILVVLLLIVSLYFYGLTSVSKTSDIVSINIKEGMGKKEVIKELTASKLLKSKFSAYIYVLLHRNLIIQAGEYELDRNFDAKEIFKRLNEGTLFVDGVTLTFIEGKRLTTYMEQLEESLGFSEEEILNTLKDQDYLKSLIKEYDFLDDSILNSELYYSLEGYLFPATYNFSKKISIEDVFRKMLDKTGEILAKYQKEIADSDYTNHEILTMASIIENETMRSEDRSIASQVIYKRLAENMNLGMDVTTYYGARKNLGEVLTEVDLKAKNAYNTRASGFLGLPVGPICNPSEASIKAALNPSSTDYLYFYADKDGKLHFAKDYDEFQEIINEYRW